MSLVRTFAPLKASAFVTGNSWTSTVADSARQNADIAAYLGGHFDLGGDDRGILSTSYTAVNAARTYDLNGDSLGGMTLEAVVFYYSDGSTGLNVRLRNKTDSSDAGAIAAASTSTGVAREVFTLTLASGIKTYELQVIGTSDSDAVVRCWGYLRMRSVPA